jgi:tRNA(fMet)-specific endonuclease VapC
MYMLDTDTCIFAVKKKTEALLTALRSHINDGLSISSITLAELEFGIAKNSQPAPKSRRSKICPQIAQLRCDTDE